MYQDPSWQQPPGQNDSSGPAPLLAIGAVLALGGFVFPVIWGILLGGVIIVGLTKVISSNIP